MVALLTESGSANWRSRRAAPAISRAQATVIRTSCRIGSVRAGNRNSAANDAVRDRLMAIGLDLSVYSNDLSAIHTVLKRLNEAGEILLIPRQAGKHAYLWQRPARVIALSPEIAEFVRGHHPQTAPPTKPTKRTKR